MKKSKYTDSQVMSILKQASAGISVPELCREHGISSATFYKWASGDGSHVFVETRSFLFL